MRHDDQAATVSDSELVALDVAALDRAADPAERVIALVEPATRLLLRATDVNQVDDARSKAAAIETYVRQRDLGIEALGAARTIHRRAEMRIGELLERQKGGRGKQSPTADCFSRDEAWRYRLLAEHREDVERLLAERADEASQLRALNFVKRIDNERRQQNEAEARRPRLADVPADATGPGWRLLRGDFRVRLAELADGTLDAIVTDPPYAREFLPLWGELSRFAARLLKPQGLLIALTGQIMLPEVIASLGGPLAFGWCYVQPMPGQNSRIMARHVMQTWKAWLVYSNGTWPSGAIDWHEDTTPPSVMRKGFSWQQDGAPAAYLIERLSSRGAAICDPFAGSGTYGAAAIDLGREFIGVELDAERFDKAKARLNKAAGG
jgi:site-specific DNA-methyltransferase (adenine-specific)